MTEITRTATADEVAQFKGHMAEARESRSDANAAASSGREVLKGLGYGPASIAMFKRLSDMGKEAAEAVFSELCQLLEADPDFDYGTQPDMFAAAVVAETKATKTGNGRRKGAGVTKGDAQGALEAARQHLGTDENAHPPV